MGNCAELQLAPGFDTADLRRALSAYATGIAVITTTDAAGLPVGMTVNSFTSVSLDPPLVLWCLARTSSSFAPFAACSCFAVNVLSREQGALSRQFAAKGADRFARSAWYAGQTGSPLLPATLATFECAVADRHDAGDHVIFIGRVMHYSRGDGEPLVFHSGAYWAGERAEASA